MKKRILTGLITMALFSTAFILIQTERDSSENVQEMKHQTEWSLNATAIEACTCPMFCQCYFNTEPAAHSYDHGDADNFCRFNMAWKVNDGHFGATNLSDAVYWIAGDLGGSWEDGTMDWAALHFDPSVTAEQREGIANILGNLFPVEWNSFIVGEDKTISWRANSQEAVALLDDGLSAEVRLTHPPTSMSEEPAVLTNIMYWGAPRHDGFVMMPNEIQAYREGNKTFESSGSNGFMITVDIHSGDM